MATCKNRKIILKCLKYYLCQCIITAYDYMYAWMCNLISLTLFSGSKIILCTLRLETCIYNLILNHHSVNTLILLLLSHFSPIYLTQSSTSSIHSSIPQFTQSH